MNPSCPSERGGVLVWILIAVALFAALSFAMMRDGGTGSAARTMSDAQARLHAAEIVSYGNQIREAVRRLRIRGVSDDDLSFENDVFMRVDGIPLSSASRYPNCASSQCRVFHPQGGGIMARYPSEGSLDYEANPANPTDWKTGSMQAIVADMDGIGTAAFDLAWLVSYVRREVCMKINDLLGVANPDGGPPVMVESYRMFTYANANPFAGTVSGSFSGGAVVKRSSYCFRWAHHNEYAYVTTLIAR
ncbi:MAG: hypothetical protein WCY57_01205 [Micavibrio sp.]